MSSCKHTATEISPFDLHQTEAYRAWRTQKLSAYPATINDLMVPITDPAVLSAAEKRQMLNILHKTNMVFYSINGGKPADKLAIKNLGLQLGLVRLDSNICADEDSITSLQVVSTGRHQGYIPYTSKRLSWHTDGYYNAPDKQIRAIVMHCVCPALEGGANFLLDHEILYMHLRDENPAYISALMHPNAMTIPPNVEEGDEIRGEQSGPVFSIDACGHLHMRYSARTRNIIWRDDPVTHQAALCITALLNGESPYIVNYRLQANQGVICNNVLHNRTGFTDGDTVQSKRLLYRARYFDRVSDI